MSNAGIIAVVAAGGAVGFLLWRRSQVAAPAPSSSVCDDLCKAGGLEGAQLAACKAACALAGTVLGAVDPLHDSLSDVSGELDSRRSTNDKLNGAPVAPPLVAPQGAGSGRSGADNASYLALLQGGVYRYQNGCEPFFGAPGWGKCASGTQDMYRMAVLQASGTADTFGNGGEKDARVAAVYVSLEAKTAALAQAATDDEADNHWYEVDWSADQWNHVRTEALNKDHYGTGASGDPLTGGPYASKTEGAIEWIVRGKRITTQPGFAPRAIVMRAAPTTPGLGLGQSTQAQVDAAIIALTDAAALAPFPIAGTQAGGTGVSSTAAGCAEAMAAGLTWDPSQGGYWRRRRAGETAKCPPPDGGGGGGGKVATVDHGNILTHGF